jgi:hypothetical protein
VQAHGFVDRVSKDIDLFTTMTSTADFPAAQAAVVTALEADGLAVAVEREGATFARLVVADPGSGEISTLELGVVTKIRLRRRWAAAPTWRGADAPSSVRAARAGDPPSAT